MAAFVFPRREYRAVKEESGPLSLFHVHRQEQSQVQELLEKRDERILTKDDLEEALDLEKKYRQCGGKYDSAKATEGKKKDPAHFHRRETLPRVASTAWASCCRRGGSGGRTRGARPSTLACAGGCTCVQTCGEDDRREKDLPLPNETFRVSK